MLKSEFFAFIAFSVLASGLRMNLSNSVCSSLCSVPILIVLAAVAGHCDIFVGCSRHIHLNPSLMVHNIESLGIILKTFCRKRMCRPFPLGLYSV